MREKRPDLDRAVKLSGISVCHERRVAYHGKHSARIGYTECTRMENEIVACKKLKARQDKRNRLSS
jgi:hypothetical protein